MSLSIRREVLEQLHAQVQEHGVIPLNRQDRFKAIQGLEAGRQQNEENRRKLLLHDLARFYRVAIFGSARLPEDSEEFKFITRLTQSLVEARDVDIVTGGGPGIMKAGNLGLRLAIKNPERTKRYRARSFGITISSLPDESVPNEHLHFESKNREFYTRLQDFVDRTAAAFIAPGGYGTWLEMSFALQNKQVGHIEDGYPLIADPFWEPVMTAFYRATYHQRSIDGNLILISEKDLQMIRFTNKIPEIVDIISLSYDNWNKNIRRHVQMLR